MLDVLGQPEDYSQMLKRVFLFTSATGIICTLVLAYFSPPIQAALLGSGAKLSLGFIDLPWLVVVIPFALAIISRAIKLHDMVATLLGIRRRFDIGQILLPMAQQVGITLDAGMRETISASRHKLMRNVFYEYAPNAKDAVINRQYVADALAARGETPFFS